MEIKELNTKNINIGGNACAKGIALISLSLITVGKVLLIFINVSS